MADNQTNQALEIQLRWMSQQLETARQELRAAREQQTLMQGRIGTLEEQAQNSRRRLEDLSAIVERMLEKEEVQSNRYAELQANLTAANAHIELLHGQLQEQNAPNNGE